MTAVANYWTAYGSELAEAYARAAGSMRFDLVTRALVAVVGDEPIEVLDIGGGYGEQAILLARLGHKVTVVDCDQTMLDYAADKLDNEPDPVRSRVELLLGSGAEAASVTDGRQFDLTLCHSVLLYEPDPTPCLAAMTATTRPGGYLSIISSNANARAMRSGLQQRWTQTLASLLAGTQQDDRCRPTVEHRREDIVATLDAMGAEEIGWHGLGVFTDHLTETIIVEDLNEVLLCEWVAGNTDPYRQVARSFHQLARRREDT